MTLFHDTRSFLNREWGWSVLLILLLWSYAANLLWRPTAVEKQKSSAVVEFHEAEAKLKEQIRDAGGVQEYLVQRPGLFLVFQTLSFFLIACVAVGILLDLVWTVRPQWRRQLLAGPGPPKASSWGLSSVLKVALLFITFALGLGLLLAWLKTRFLPNSSPNFLSLVHTTLSDLSVMAFVVYFLRRRGANWQDLGFRGARLVKDLWIGLAGYVAILPIFLLILAAVAFVAYVLTYEPPPHPLVEIFLEEEKRSPAVVAYSVFLACVAGPFFEEIFFRGFCYPAFKKRWGMGWGLVLSSAFFALIHQNAFAFLPILVLGIGLAYLYEKRGTLVPSIALHIVHNGVFIGYFFLIKEVLAGS